MSGPFVLIARMRAKSGQQARLRQELQLLVGPTRAEPGCITYDLHESEADPAEFMFYEAWKSPADLDAHFETPHMKAMKKIEHEIVEGGMDLSIESRIIQRHFSRYRASNLVWETLPEYGVTLMPWNGEGSRPCGCCGKG